MVSFHPFFMTFFFESQVFLCRHGVSSLNLNDWIRCEAPNRLPFGKRHGPSFPPCPMRQAAIESWGEGSIVWLKAVLGADNIVNQSAVGIFFGGPMNTTFTIFED